MGDDKDMDNRWEMRLQSSDIKRNDLKFIYGFIIIYTINSIFYFSSDLFDFSSEKISSVDRNEKRSEISLSKIKTDERSVIKNLSNVTKIAEVAEKVIEDAFQQLRLVE